jgi:hypothetical protein
MDIAITFLYFPAFAYLAYHFKSHRALFLLMLACFPYFMSITIYYVFPYEYVYPINNTLVGATLLGLIAYAAILALVFRRPLKSASTNTFPRSWVLIAAYLCPLTMLIEFWISPVLSIRNTLDVNRLLLEYTSSLYVIAYLLSGASLFLLMFVRLNQTRKDFLIIIIPWLLGSACNFLVGNRQFFFMGCIVMFFSLIARADTLKRIFKVKYIMWFSATVLVLYTVQFARDTYQASRQDQNFYNVFSISPKSENVVTSNYFLNTFCVVLYAYYGIEFCAYSAYVDNAVVANTALLLNFPLVYKRILPSGGVDKYAELSTWNMTERQEAISAFSNIWMTMFGSFYMEYGFASLILYPLIYLAAIIGFVKSAAGKSGNVICIFIFVCATIAFGVEYFVFNEHFAYLLLALVVAPLKFTTIVRQAALIEKAR